MAKKIVALYLDDTSIRLLVSDGKRVKKWADRPLEPGLIKSNVIIKEAEVAASIGQLLREQKVSASKAIVGLSGLHCLSRPIALPQLPRAMLEEAIVREARRALPVPVEQLYLSWDIVPSNDEQVHLFLAGVPRKTADALVKVLRQAGIRPYLMDLKPLALARLSPQSTAIIADVQPAELDIIILADGIPQPIRTVSLPSASLSSQEKLPLIRDELDRTIQFYNSTHPEKPLADSVPLFVGGELANEVELHQSLSDEVGHPTWPLPSTLKYPDGFEPSRYLVNLGLVLKEEANRKTPTPLLVNLNALPAPYQPKPISLVKVVGLPAAVTMASLMAFLIMMSQNASADIASMRNQMENTNKILQTKLQQKQELAAAIAKQESTLSEVKATRDAFTSAYDSLSTRGDQTNGDLTTVTGTLPHPVSLANINHSGDTVNLSGGATDELAVLDYARNLDGSGRFSQVVISSMRRTEDGGMGFTLVLREKG